ESDADRQVMGEALDAMIKMLAPITPHICEQLWRELGHQDDLIFAPWPAVDDSALVEEEKLIVVQVNGKVRAKLTVAADATAEQVEEQAFSDAAVKKYTDGKTVRKKIYVPGKIFNIVVS
ncbi:MAG TPA: leucine--tRNA ligase, partial [Idiomarina sp.]|nr:leucine--tRNA ligase [Idiomarina sp.]